MKITFFLLMGLLCVLLLPVTFGAPIEDDDVNDDNAEEDRRHRRRRRKRPCGRDASGDGRTFFDWSYSYLNVNHNYNVNCGGGGGGPAIGGGYIPSIRPGHHQGNKFGSQGFGNGLHGAHGGNNLFGNKGGGLFGLGLFDWFLSNPPAQTINNNPSNSDNAPNSDDNQDYDEVDDKPVSENYDDIPEGHQNFKPGQYVTAYNPIFGNYVQDISNYKPKRIINQVDKLFRPFYDLFK